MKCIITTMLFIAIVSSVLGTFIIPRTITVTAPTLNALRSSMLPASPYYDPYIANLSDSDETVMPEESESLPTRAAPPYVDQMNWAVNNHLEFVLYDDSLDEMMIQPIVDILLNDIPPDSIALNYFTDTSFKALDRALHLIYYTQNAAMLYDCLYHAPTTYVPESVKIKLKNILYRAVQLTEESINSYNYLTRVDQSQWGVNLPDNYPYPGFSIIQYRFQMLATSGLAALLLRETVPEWVDEMNEHLDYVNHVFFQQSMPSTFPQNQQVQGMLAFHTGNSGAFIESLEYQSSMHQKISLFFTAYKRLSGGSINYFNNQYYVSWIRDLISKGVPTEADWPYNDNWGNFWISPGPIIFYYNNTNNPQVRNDCAWYYKSKPRWNHPYNYSTSGAGSCRSNLLVRYLSDPYVMPRMGSINSVPTFVSQGSLSNSEFTILRDPIEGDIYSASAHVKDTASMYILHDNSFAPYHNQSDHLSYSLYYKGKPFLIDPGYRVGIVAVPNPNELEEWNYSREWMRSIYAHNMVIVDPDYEKELTELRDRYWEFRNSTGPGLAGAYRPASPFTKYNEAIVNQEDIVRDPCFRDYYQHSEQLDLLRTMVVYDDNSSNLPKVELKRSFLKYDDLFVVCDDLEALDGNLHEYSSLYQFGVFDNTSASVNISSHGFAIQKGTDIVDMICGSTGSHVNLLDGIANGYNEAVFPTSYILESSPDRPNSVSNLPNNRKYGHPRGRTKVIEAADTSILTIIAPRDTSNPYAVQSTTHLVDSYYGVNLSQNSRSIPAVPVNKYIGNTNGSLQSMTFGGNEINTDAKLYAVSIFSGVQPYVLDQSIVLLDGSSLKYNGTELYKKYSGNNRGVTATYSGTALDIVFHGYTPSYPRFKVYRSGTVPEQFTAIMYTHSVNHIPIPFDFNTSNSRYPSSDIVQSLAYDDKYFYVNYSWNDLVSANLVNEDLVLVKGEIPQTDLYTTLNIKGDVEITGHLCIKTSGAVSVSGTSSLLISDGVSILNHGVVSMDGGNSRSINISAAEQSWSGITTYRNGILTCNGVKIDKATTGIQIRGTAYVTNSEIKNCGTGISIETGTPFTISGNNIYMNSNGILVSNNYTSTSLAGIESNEISENRVGILMYNSNTKVAYNDIHNNTRSGIYLIRGSEPPIKGCIIRQTELNGLSRPEIVLESDSYPILDDAQNDINTDGIGYSLYYDSNDGIRELMARNNYWGSTDPSEIRQWIYPIEWVVEFDPFCREPNTINPPVNGPLKLALAAEEGGNTVLAKQLYTTIVETEPQSLHALQSLGRLNSLYSKSPEEVGDLRAIYGAYSTTCSDTVLVKCANLKKIMVDRFDGLYPSALQKYEDELLNCYIELDSLLCLLDIAYTIQDMYYDDQEKGISTGSEYQAHGIQITSLKDAKLQIDQLWDTILSESVHASSGDIVIPGKLDVANYPNPFNPSTTIAFSIPSELPCKLDVYNLRGQKVRSLVNETVMAGNHSIVWNGKDDSGKSVSSGVYFYRLSTPNKVQTSKMLLMK